MRELTLKKKFTFNTNGYIYPFVMVVYMLYLSLIAIYTAHFNIQLKTLDNIESYYEKQIQILLHKGRYF